MTKERLARCPQRGERWSYLLSRGGQCLCVTPVLKTFQLSLYWGGWVLCELGCRMGKVVDVTLPDTEVVLVMPDLSDNLVEQALVIFGRLWDSLVYMEREEERELEETSKENLRVILLLLLLLITLASLCLCLLAILCCTCRAAR